MARLTKQEATQKRTQIKDLLLQGVPMADIASRLHCSLRTVVQVKQGDNGNDNGNITLHPGTSRSIPSGSQERSLLRFMNEFFKDNLDHLFKSKAIQEFIMNHPEFDEVEQLCQA